MHDTPSFERHIIAPGDIAAQAALLPRPLVFTNGVFDILHRGHATYLAQARALGGSLVVALNSDASARRLGKGPDRPLNKETDRAVLMAALRRTATDKFNVSQAQTLDQIMAMTIPEIERRLIAPRDAVPSLAL